MITKLSLYFPVAEPDVQKFFPKAKPKKKFLRLPTGYSIPTPDGVVELSKMPAGELDLHLNGFIGYIMQLQNVTADKARAMALVKEVKTVFGVKLPVIALEDSPLFKSLCNLAFEHGGFVFAHDSILMADGYLVGSAVIDETDPVRIRMREIREQNLARLSQAGFSPYENLPLDMRRSLRPKGDIVKRLAALNVLVCYVIEPESHAPAEALRRVIEKEGLAPYLTENENEIIDTPRSEVVDRYGNSIGWSIENMWPLAWLLGYPDKPEPLSPMMEGDRIRSVIKFAEDDPTGGSRSLRAEEDVLILCDLFYCAHNAVRSAQQGAETVPDGFNPMVEGGLVHERRHALSWSMAPGVDWDETDLST